MQPFVALKQTFVSKKFTMQTLAVSLYFQVASVVIPPAKNLSANFYV